VRSGAIPREIEILTSRGGREGVPIKRDGELGDEVANRFVEDGRTRAMPVGCQLGEEIGAADDLVDQMGDLDELDVVGEGVALGAIVVVEFVAVVLLDIMRSFEFLALAASFVDEIDDVVAVGPQIGKIDESRGLLVLGLLAATSAAVSQLF
jgi:hypothetical protein